MGERKGGGKTEREQNGQKKRLPIWVPALDQTTGVFQSVSTLVEKFQNTKISRTPELQAGILLCLLDLGCSPSQVYNKPVCHKQILQQTGESWTENVVLSP